jgi:hypothetical protein
MKSVSQVCGLQYASISSWLVTLDLPNYLDPSLSATKKDPAILGDVQAVSIDLAYVSGTTWNKFCGRARSVHKSLLTEAVGTLIQRLGCSMTTTGLLLLLLFGL